jgi:hypothetical protein
LAKSLDGGGWIVRRFVPGNGKWHPSVDQLVGTDVYGTEGSTVEAWSIEFKSSTFEQFLFVSGDFTKWMIMTRLEAIGTDATPALYSNDARTIYKSSIIKEESFKAKMYRNSVEVCISMEDCEISSDNDGILYGDDS